MSASPPILIPPVLPVKGQGTDRIPCPAIGSVPITTGQKRLLIERLQEAGTGCLKALIFDHRDA
jgi:hypothetical protein